jgi:hypothetical protein
MVLIGCQREYSDQQKTCARRGFRKSPAKAQEREIDPLGRPDPQENVVGGGRQLLFGAATDTTQTLNPNSKASIMANKKNIKVRDLKPSKDAKVVVVVVATQQPTPAPAPIKA